MKVLPMASTSRTDFVAPPPPAGPFEYSVSSSSSNDDDSESGVGGEQSSYWIPAAPPTRPWANRWGLTWGQKQPGWLPHEREPAARTLDTLIIPVVITDASSRILDHLVVVLLRTGRSTCPPGSTPALATAVS